MSLPSFLAFCIERDSAHYEPPIFLSFLHWKGLGSSFLFIYYLGKTCTTFIHLTWKSWNLWLPSSTIMVNHSWLLIQKISLPPAWSSCTRMYDLANWELPCPWVKCKGFFFVQKETPTSKAQMGWRGSISLISPVFMDLKQCLYIVNRVLLKSIQPEILHFKYHHPPSKIFS